MSIITVDRSKPFDQHRFFCEELTALPYGLDSPFVESVNIDKLRYSYADAEPSMTGATHVDASGFAALWDNRDKLPIPEIPAGQSFFQCYCRGTLFLDQSHHGSTCQMFFLRWGPNYWIGPPDPKWHWGMTSIVYEWGYKFPNLILTF